MAQPRADDEQDQQDERWVQLFEACCKTPEGRKKLLDTVANSIKKSAAQGTLANQTTTGVKRAVMVLDMAEHHGFDVQGLRHLLTGASA